MRRSSIIGWMSIVLLAACGGKNTIVGTSTTTAGTGAGTISAIAVTSNTAQIAADGSTSATISAVAKNASNAFVSGANIGFTASAGGIAITQGTTDTNGLATATLTASGAAAGTNITVTATSPDGTTGTVVVAVVNIKETIALTTSSPQIPSDGSKPATITALVRDANNNFIKGIAVNFTATSGGLTVTQGTTDATGSAIATLTSANDPSTRIVTVTATAGSATATVTVAVQGTALSVSGPSSLVLGSTGTYTVSLVNSSGTAIANASVKLASALGNTLSEATLVTGSSNTFTMTATQSGKDTITATALGNTSSETVSVSAQSFTFTTPAATTPPGPTNVDLGVSQPLTVTWAQSGVPQAGQTVSFSSTRGTLSAATAVTNAAGQATVNISSTVAGPATVTASVPIQSGQLTALQSLEFIATQPASIAVQASPATIATGGASTITAIVRDADNNLVENAIVDFKTVNDTTGGALSVASATTNSQGEAQTTYNASTTSSATNGVVIQATVQGTAIAQTADLTVGGITVFLSLGTGNIIQIYPANLPAPEQPTQFAYPYSVEAVDAAGNPVANVAISLAIHPLYYFKGGYIVYNSAWVQTGTPGNTAAPTAITACPNEDKHFNGVYEPGEDGYPGNPDFNPYGNQNGKLDPGGTAVASPASLTTGVDGSANFVVIYPQSEAQWVQVELLATATVAGTETTASSTFFLPMLASYITTTTSSPPGNPSPYGVAQACTNPN